MLSLVLCLACYKGLLVSAAASVLQLGAWAKLLQENILFNFFLFFTNLFSGCGDHPLPGSGQPPAVPGCDQSGQILGTEIEIS